MGVRGRLQGGTAPPRGSPGRAGGSRGERRARPRAARGAPGQRARAGRAPEAPAAREQGGRGLPPGPACRRPSPRADGVRNDEAPLSPSPPNCPLPNFCRLWPHLSLVELVCFRLCLPGSLLTPFFNARCCRPSPISFCPINPSARGAGNKELKSDLLLY